MDLDNKNFIITGASRGIGAAIAASLAKRNANLFLIAKTLDQHPKLSGSLQQTLQDIQSLGNGTKEIFALDIRDLEKLQGFVDAIQARGIAIDGLINNAGSVMLGTFDKVTPKRFRLMNEINVQAPYALVHMLHRSFSTGAHIVNIAPSTHDYRKWMPGTTAYSLTKYGLSILTTGLAQELADIPVYVNGLWPEKLIATAAIEHVVADKALFPYCRKPEIMGDAVIALLHDQDRPTGQFFTDTQVLQKSGVTDFVSYCFDPSYSHLLKNDLYIN